jgi:hypothetical protein
LKEMDKHSRRADGGIGDLTGARGGGGVTIESNSTCRPFFCDGETDSVREVAILRSSKVYKRLGAAIGQSRGEGIADQKDRFATMSSLMRCVKSKQYR